MDLVGSPPRQRPNSPTSAVAAAGDPRGSAGPTGSDRDSMLVAQTWLAARLVSDRRVPRVQPPRSQPGQAGQTCTAARLAITAQSGKRGRSERQRARPGQVESGLVAGRPPHQGGGVGRGRAHSPETRPGRTGQDRLGWQPDRTVPRVQSGGPVDSSQDPADRLTPRRFVGAGWLFTVS